MSSLSTVLNCERGQFNSSLTCSYSEKMIEEVLPDWMLVTEGLPWFSALLGSIFVGLAGVFPLLVIPIDDSKNLKHGGGEFWIEVTYVRS